MEEANRLGVSPMFATHAHLHPGHRRPTVLDSAPHEFTDTKLVDGLERICCQEAVVEICRHHPALDIVTAETECQLREVVCTEREEVRSFGHLAGANCGSRCLNHRADRDVTVIRRRGVDLRFDPPPSERQFGTAHRERNHHLDDRMQPLDPQHLDRGEERPDLHCIQAGLQHPEANPASPDHRIVFGPRLSGS